ncbi:FAD-dependent monooxygenase [Comamonas thiooxydans]|uniref:Putative m-aminobenzoate hydroxylase n=1 Tax=Comamonas testosteroni TaxID=285 RepID=A0A1V0J9R0_COMTE|nr:FAD-dependent monooxygenase [Comamonas thiooxydans]ARD05467.1 putative m-aminobenzoate hydroxylase [Comamonas testosteroni]
MENTVGRDRRVLIAGGGIGGLAAGAALANLGFRITILEQAEDFKEVGAGVQIAPNGVRALGRLGLMDRINTFAWRPNALVMRDAVDASDILRIPLGERFIERFDEAYRVIHRADLLAVLLEACKQNPRVRLETSARVLAVDDGPEVALHLADGRTLRGEILIGADGLRSVVRQTLIGDGAPRPPRYIVYRGVIPRSELPDDLWESEVVMWTGPDADFVHYPLRTGELFNLVATFKASKDLSEESIAGSREDLMAPYIQFHPSVQRMLALLNTERRWMVTDREPVSGWSRGSITLIGDAAHPMLQYMAQGACQALEDVVRLVDEVQAQPEDIPAAFSAYAEGRYRRTARVQFSARQLIEVCQVGGVMAEVRRSYFSQRSDEQKFESLAWLYSDRAGEKFQ